MATREPDYFVRAERNKTKVKLQVYDVPELTDPETAEKYGRKAKTTRESARTIKRGFIRDGWHNVAILGPDGLVIE